MKDSANQRTLEHPAPRVRPIVSLADARLRGYTPADIMSLAYGGFCLIVIVSGWDRVANANLRFAAYAAVLCAIALLRFAPRHGWRPLQFVRESYPLLLFPVLYPETAALGRAFTSGYYDATVLGWERALFGTLPSQEFSRWVQIPAISELLHFCYLAYIGLVPVLGLTLFLSGRSEAFRVFVTTILLTFLTCYATFILFPVRGPYYELARPDVPSWSLFPPIVHAMLERGAAVGAAFPSSHVAGAVAVAFMGYLFSRRLSYVVMIIAAGILFGTVYGGFHYGVDALVGLLWGIVASILGPRVHQALLRETRRDGAARRLRLRWNESRDVEREPAGDQR